MKAWKQAAKKYRLALQGALKRAALWEGLAKERPNAKAQQELDLARIDAFTGWVSARILRTALEQAIALGRFSASDRALLERELAKVHFQDPDQFKC